MPTITQWLDWARGPLASVDSPGLSARVLLEHSLGLDRLGLVMAGDKEVPREQGERFRQLVARRAKGEPVAYLVGAKEFYGLSFAVGPGVLVPRPETELLVDLALEWARGRERFCFADLGTGSGCLAVALAVRCPGALGVAVELDPGAAALARANILCHKVAGRVCLVRGDFATGLLAPGSLDLCLSNPPYVTEAEYAGLGREVRDFEPRAALESGPDGLDAPRTVAARAREWLKPGGTLFMEIGSGQGRVVSDMVRTYGFDNVRVVRDLAGWDRVVTARKGTC